MRIVITEFMDEAAVVGLAERFDVCYDKDLVDRPDQLAVQVADADALIVRNRTSVDCGAAQRRAELASSDASASGSTTSTRRRARRAAST